MEKKEYIERGAAVDELRRRTKTIGELIAMQCDSDLLKKVLSIYYNAREEAAILIEEIPTADVVEVVHGDAEREYVESLLKRHAAYLLAKIDSKGAHVGKFEDITLDADGNWIIEADIESLSVTECGDFAPVVRCKDCKYAYINSFSAASGMVLCEELSNAAETAIRQQDEYCSHGERREE